MIPRYSACRPQTPRRARVPGGAFRQADGGDHRPAPSHGGIVCNNLFHIRRARRSRSGPYSFMPGENIKIAAQRLNIHRVVHHRLSAIHQHFRAMLMRKQSFPPAGFPSPARWRPGYRQQASFRVKQRRHNSSCSVPSGLSGITRSSAPTRAQSICHGTILAWCSISTDDDVIARRRRCCCPSCWRPG